MMADLPRPQRYGLAHSVPLRKRNALKLGLMHNARHYMPMQTLKILLAGDLMTGRGIDQILHHPGHPALQESFYRDARDYVELAEQRNGPILRRVGSEHIWGDALVQVEHAQPELRIANLETAVTSHATRWPGKSIHYRMHPKNVECLKSAGWSALSLANNHTLDFGREGLDETQSVLHQAGIATAGGGRDGTQAWSPARLHLTGGGEVLLFSCATSSSGVPGGWAAGVSHSGIALLPDLSDSTARDLAADASHHRRDHGVVIISIHWGPNASPTVPQEHRRFARRLIDLGAADIVHGHSSHHPMPVEVYRGRLILYGCGDLINDYEGIPPSPGLRSDVACLYFATVDRQRGTLQKLHVIAMQMYRFRLVHADAAARQWVESRFNNEGLNLGTHMLARRVGWNLQWGRSVSQPSPPTATPRPLAEPAA